MNYQRLQVANKIAKKMWSKYHPDIPVQTRPRQRVDGVSYAACLGTYRKTKVFCSDFCCGNPRKHFGQVTNQEKRARLNQMDEY